MTRRKRDFSVPVSILRFILEHLFETLHAKTYHIDIQPITNSVGVTKTPLPQDNTMLVVLTMVKNMPVELS